MSTIQVQVMDQGQLDKMQALLAGIPGGTERAAKSAMQRAVTHLRANSAKAIQEKYDISTANIRANENVTVRYTYQSGVQAVVNFAGRKIPLYPVFARKNAPCAIRGYAGGNLLVLSMKAILFTFELYNFLFRLSSAIAKIPADVSRLFCRILTSGKI